MTAQQEIDDIWATLKEDTSLLEPNNNRKVKSISHLWESQQSITKKSTINNHAVIRPAQLHNWKQRESSRSSKNSIPIRSTTKDDTDKEVGRNAYSESTERGVSQYEEEEELHDEILLEDSDDDSDLGTPITNEQNSLNNRKECASEYIHPTKLHRLVALMRSDDTSQRIEALKNLCQEINNLYNQIDAKIPKLDFPAPYDVSKIALTHKRYGTVISDLAKGDYVRSWTKWQRTKSSVSDQFPEKQMTDSLSTHQDCVVKEEEEDANISKHLQTILDICAATLFRRFSDKSELCRSKGLECMKLLCLSRIDIGKHLGYLMPAILGKYTSVSFDDEMNVFVDDIEDHMFYKRGGATERQDRTGLLSNSQTVKVVDRSEEIRYSVCELLSCIVRCFVNTGASSTLDPYFSDIVLALQSHLKDPFPKLKIEASNLLVQMIRVPQWEQGAKIFATAIARVAIPNLRHRNSKVRISAIRLFEASVCVPNREKIRGAGTDAIADLVGFREENVLPIAAFYRRDCGVSVNTLAELVADRSIAVRLACCEMLSFLINCLPDRYEHQQRLLPYLLIFFNDDNHDIQRCGINAIDSCGEQYEAEHPDDVIERRQYGVDGGRKCNHKDQLPFPFVNRPRLGSRLFVRANTKRFFDALLSELTCWQSKTRIQSAKLLCILVVYCEEHLTMDCNKTILSIVKALLTNLNDDDVEGKTLRNVLLHLFELMGRYIEPSAYIKILLPRAIGDISSATTFSEGGIHSESSCMANTIALQSMMKGTLSSALLSQFFTLISSLTSSLLQFEMKGTKIKREILRTLVILFNKLEGESLSGAQSACFHSSGRIHNYEDLIIKCKVALEQLIFKTNESDVQDLASNLVEIVTKRIESS